METHTSTKGTLALGDLAMTTATETSASVGRVGVSTRP